MTGPDPDPGGQASDHDRLAPDAAGYVLGSLTVAEQLTFESHLVNCQICRSELQALDPVPVLLDLARAEPPGGQEQVAPGGGARVAPHRSRRSRALVASALAVALVGAVVAGVSIRRAGSPRFTEPVALHGLGPGPAPVPGPSGSASWRPTPAGTVVRLDLVGLAVDGTFYECVWIPRGGIEQSAGTFRPDANGKVQVDLVTAASRYPGWRVEVRAHPPRSPGEPPRAAMVVLQASG